MIPKSTQRREIKTMRQDITIGSKYYDEANGLYITVKGKSCDPHAFSCEAYEVDDNGDLVEVPCGLLTDRELNHYTKVN
jgi:hypothetical protein